MSPPLSVSPEAAFIAASAASQIVTSDHDGHSESWYDQVGIAPSGEAAVVSPGALQLANNFVDQLLFNMIAVAGSTSLSALRAAVSDVLKPKLAKDAINQADEELREYLGGGEVEDLVGSPTTEPSSDWDLELAWKRARLRCMVYSSLGDLEEEDEDYYMEQEHLRADSDDISSESVSPAVAIFLTSILEFMGEQVLVISGQAAFNRLRVKYEKEFKDGSRSAGDVAERLVVEELDMERVALDRTIGRLWRAWKKRIRSTTEPNFSRPFSRSSISASSNLPHTRPGSMATFTDRASPSALLKDPDFAKEAEETRLEEESKLEDDNNNKSAAEIRPSAIPLPMGGNDVAEIEVPGLVSYSDDEGSDEEDREVTRGRPRPRSSILFFQHSNIETPVPTGSEPQAPAGPRRGRSNSLPTPAAQPYISPSQANTSTAPSAIDQQAQESLSKDQIAQYARDKVGSGPNGTASATPNIVHRSITTANRQKARRSRAAGDEGEIDEFEEAQILTTSRISIGGRSSPAVSEGGIGRPPSILIARSNSVGSARLINVQSPRSPSIGSRTGSWEVEYSRSTDISREGSICAPTPPIAEEQEQDQKLPQPISANEGKKRSGFVMPPNLDVNIASGANLRSRSPPKSVPSPSLVPPPIPAHTSTKVTILSTPTPRSSSLPENFDVPHRSNYRNAPLPTLPEKSAGRQTRGQTKTSTVPVTPQQGSPESAKFQRPKPADSPASSTSNKLKAFRNSEDSSPQRPTDIKRHFEELIHSDQTLQYTLTPEHMREASVSFAVVFSISSKSSPNKLAQSSKSSRSNKDGSSVIHMPQDSEDVNITTQRSQSRSRSSSQRSLSLSKSTGLNSHPPTDVIVSGKHTGPGSKPPVSMPMKSRSASTTSASTTRDARTPVDSTQDFAGFIRGTGPQGTPNRVRTGSVANARNDSPPVTVARSISSVNRSTSSLARARLQAREAAVTSSNGSSELIDFIRRGPQDSASNNPRIPRHVAPFRSTMDSDQLLMSGATGGKAVDAVLPNIRDSSQASTNVTDASAPSSFNSHSALLNKANKPTAYAPDNFDDEDMVPKRKQRRVRDPYAIDLSDEDDDLFDEVLPKPKPPKKEESLIDFLNSYEPPPEPESKPAMAPPMLPKKKSAPNLMQRLRAGAHSNSGSFGLTRRGSNVERISHQDSRSLHSRASTVNRGYTPIAVNIPPGADKYAPDLMPPPSRAQTSSSNRVPMKRYEARDAHSSATRTSDLASFLRESEPPPSMLASSDPPTNDKAGGGISRMFERRKKSTVF
ncbi:hypothetical protein SLS62_001920 [Diatrype stigma]|uniref:Uncharacterized protein n=1 Tax=Diatrype stigma TaxID=117547 RepID=A0AAN9V9F9_9PEZI